MQTRIPDNLRYIFKAAAATHAGGRATVDENQQGSVGPLRGAAQRPARADVTAIFKTDARYHKAQDSTTGTVRIIR